MLLLVLILVLVAFALLVVALVQGSVLWAWLSVAVSIAAAGALLVDWWQRQQTLKAEDSPPGLGGGPRLLEPMSPSLDSATDFIPVQPRVEQGSTAVAGSLFAPLKNDEPTVLLPFSRPSGSEEQPPGATSPATPWGGAPSRSVTETPSYSGGSAQSAGHGERPGDGRDGVRPVDETIFQPVEAAGAAGPLPSRIPSRAIGSMFGGKTSSVTPPAESEPEVESPNRSAAATADTDLQIPRTDEVDEVDEQVTTMVPVQPAEQLPSGPIPADTEPATRRADEQQTPAESALPPTGPDGDPPEEPYLPAAAIVAELDDEVVVVDERPRYHVTGCPFLPGRSMIPLPAREAVELGFSPCAWCGPNRVLAERHRSSASR